MKHLAIVLSVLLLLGTLTGCKSEKEPGVVGVLNDQIDDRVMTVGRDWFDENEFVAGMSQHAYQVWLRNHTYQKKPLTGNPVISFFNNASGSGFKGESLNVSYNCITAAGVTADNKKSYSYSLTLQDTVDNLTMPWNVAFGDSLPEVLAKMSITVDLLADFQPSNENASVMIVKTVDNSTLTFTNMDAVQDEEVSYLYRYQLSFYFDSTYEKIDKTDVQATSYLIFSFNEDGNLERTVFRIHEMTDAN